MSSCSRRIDLLSLPQLACLLMSPSLKPLAEQDNRALFFLEGALQHPMPTECREMLTYSTARKGSILPWPSYPPCIWYAACHPSYRWLLQNRSRRAADGINYDKDSPMLGSSKFLQCLKISIHNIRYVEVFYPLLCEVVLVIVRILWFWSDSNNHWKLCVTGQSLPVPSALAIVIWPYGSFMLSPRTSWCIRERLNTLYSWSDNMSVVGCVYRWLCKFFLYPIC